MQSILTLSMVMPEQSTIKPYQAFINIFKLAPAYLKVNAIMSISHMKRTFKLSIFTNQT